jgi:septal ring factor EnvC (AmiA/AmiB activator)
VQKRTTTTKQRSVPAKKTVKKGNTRKTVKTGKTTNKTKKAAKPEVTVKSLKNEQAQVRKEIQAQERRLQANERDVKKRLQNLMVINNEIADKRKTIDTIRQDITRLDGDIHVLENQLTTLRNELKERKRRYEKSMRYIHRNRNIQNRLMFIFSAKNFSQMYRRLRFVREYASYQQAQGEAVLSMQRQVSEAFNELKSTKRLKNDLLSRGEQEKRSLENKQVEQQNMVSSLKKQQKAIKGIIDQQKKRDADLNARIDKMIAEEIARAKAKAERAAREAENARREAERKAEEAARAHKKEVAEASKPVETKITVPAEDLRLSGSFENNRGRLPMPIAGSYKIVHRFGTNTVTDVKGHVTLDKKGIDIKGQPGAAVRCIYDGVVSTVFGYYGTTVVIIKHGSYLSVYCDLASVTVSSGQKVSARQTIGRVGPEGMMQFQLRKGNTKLNPEVWLQR